LLQTLSKDLPIKLQKIQTSLYRPVGCWGSQDF